MISKRREGCVVRDLHSDYLEIQRKRVWRSNLADKEVKFISYDGNDTWILFWESTDQRYKGER